MNKTAKIYITIITIITIAAIIIGMCINVFDGGFSGKQHSDTVSITDDISDIDIDVDATGVTVEYGDTPSVVYDIYGKKAPDISVNNGTLSVNANSNEFVGFGIQKPKRNEITITVLKDVELSSIRVKSDAGDVKLNNLCGNSVDIETDAGNMKFTDIKFKSLSLEADAGNVDFTDCQTDNVNVTLDAGNLNLKNTTIETLTAEADAGNIESDDCTIKGGSVKTDFGNIKLNGDIGSVSTKTDLGTVKINGQK